MKHTVPANEAQARFLAILKEVENSRIEVLVTRDGMPVARVVPIEPRATRSIEELRGSVEILGDIVGPLNEEWDAAK
ncbi:MAG TPA: type II toxin-antitoxin system prevent-host-death family antitoxin [Thermoanaerobaculia bacterium]|jgi:prevent-host-death family protein